MVFFHPKSMEMDRLISEITVLQDLPFNFVEDDRFRRLMYVIHCAKLSVKAKTVFLRYTFVMYCILNYRVNLSEILIYCRYLE